MIKYYGGCDWLGLPANKFSRNIHVYNLWVPDKTKISKDAFNVYFDCNEPDFFQRNFYSSLCNFNPVENIQEVLENFDLVLTRKLELLSLPNSKKFLFGCSHIKDFDSCMLDKKYGISFTLTNKNNINADGYFLRHHVAKTLDIYRKKSNTPIIGFDSSQYPSNYPTLDNTLKEGAGGRDELMKYQYNLAIENSRNINYFTEKLIDCFLTKTIPIYFGCPNIGDYFDTRGFFVIKDAEDLSECLSHKISETTYDEMEPFITENYERAKYWSIPLGERLTSEIINVLQ